MKRKSLSLMITALSLSGMLLAGCNFQGPNAAINSQAGTYEKQQLYQLYAAAGGTMTYDEWLASVKGADGASLLADRKDPTDADGKNGDVFVNIETWDVFLKVGGSWSKAGNIKGAQGEQGPQGPQGPQGEPGKDGKDGQDGKDGKDGEPGKDGQDGKDGKDGEPGKDGVGIKEIKKTDNDGYSDIYTIYLTDDSEYEFKVPNPAVSLDIMHYRFEIDYEAGQAIDLPYYVGASAPLDVVVYAQYADGSEMYVEDGEYTVTGFNTETPGTREATITFGPASGTLEYEVVDISDEVGAVLSEVGATDAVPGLASGAYDYSFNTMSNQLIVYLDEGLSEADAVAAYGEGLKAAGYSEAGADGYGDMHYVSENEQLEIYSWVGADVGESGIIVVNIKVLKGFFPIGKINEFMTAVGYTFGFDETIRDAFGTNAWESSVRRSSSGDYYMLISLAGGDYVEQWVTILTPVLEENGFVWEEDYDCFFNYSTYQEIDVKYNASYDVSQIVIWQ